MHSGLVYVMKTAVNRRQRHVWSSGQWGTCYLARTCISAVGQWFWCCALIGQHLLYLPTTLLLPPLLHSGRRSDFPGAHQHRTGPCLLPITRAASSLITLLHAVRYHATRNAALLAHPLRHLFESCFQCDRLLVW